MVFAAAVVTVGCGGKRSTTGDGSGSATPKVSKDTPKGLDLRLSNGKAGAPAYDRNKVAAATKLADADIKAVLARTKPLVADPADKQTFAIRPSSQPAPRTGDTVATTFPPPASSLLPPSPTDAGKDLRVLRYMPEGKVPIAPELTVTFSQPMVAVTSQDDAAAIQPVKLTPQPAGRWRWIGTRTIVFDPEVRFPQSTTFSVEIPSGTKGISGATIKEPTTFSFETPAPKIISSYPYEHEPQRLDVPMFVTFDQRIDPKAVLSKIQVKANGSTAFGLRLLDAAEIAKDKVLERRIAAAKLDEAEGRWLAFRTTIELPSDAAIEVVIPSGTPSAEGPNKTTEDQRFTFRTYPPLKITSTKCSYNNDPCVPGQALPIELNNRLDVDKFDASQITVSPPIPNLKVVQYGQTIGILGATKPRTTYTATISSSLADDFGQTLGHTETATYRVGDPTPSFDGPNGMVVLDPAAPKPTFDLFTTQYDELVVKLYKVTPADFGAFSYYMTNQWNKDHPPPMPGKKVFDSTIKTRSKEPLSETRLDLASALDAKGLGHVVAFVEPRPWKETYDPPDRTAWIQSTKLGLSAHVDNDDLVAFVTELDTGKPLAGIEVELRPLGTKATTDASGLATISIEGLAHNAQHSLLARRGDDVAMLTDNPGWGSYGQWGHRDRRKSVTWFTVDDRRLYRPDEQVSIKGWVRVIDPNKGGDVAAHPATTLTYEVYDSRSNKIGNGTGTVNDLGGFDVSFALPKTPNLGNASVRFSLATGEVNGSHSHNLRVEEFRRPEFEVTAKASDGPFVIGETGDVTISAKYFTGAALPGADATWSLYASEASFSPPNRDDYVFGAWKPWWVRRGSLDDGAYEDYDYEGEGRMGRRGGGSSGDGEINRWNHTGKTDASGEHVLHLDFLSANPSVPMSVQASVSVTDVNRQAWSSSAALLVHPSSLYVGLKAKRPFVDKGVPFELDVLGVDIDGKVSPGAKIAVSAVRMDWEFKKGEYKQVELDPQACAVTIATDAGKCTFATKEGGSYNVTATITDAKGRTNQTKLTFYVSGGAELPARDVARQEVQLVPDKKDYTPGNTAEIMIQAPFYPAEGLVTWRRSGIVKTERITLDGPTKVITVPITDAMTPNLTVHVDLVGAAVRTDDRGVADPKLPKRPAFAAGELDLSIPPRQRTLTVVVTPAAAKLSPAEKTSLSLEVRDAAGNPVAGAEAAVFVVDESILSLTGADFTSPLETFYRNRSSDTTDRYLREHVKLSKPPKTITAANDPAPPAEAESPDDGADESGGTGTAMALEEGKMGKKENAPGAKYRMAGDVTRANAIEQARNAGVLGSVGANKNGAFASITGSGDISAGFDTAEPTTPIAIRSNFNPLAAFVPSVMTDASGKATVALTMPDNLTRYRVIAYAVVGATQFGKGESSVTARLPLMVRPSPPRFLNFGDTFMLPVVVQNQTDAPMTVKLAIQTTNLTLADGAGRQVTVPANDRVEVQFPAAAEMAGTARFQIVGSAGNATDAAEISLPVWTPTTTEAFATYGVIDNGAMAQPIALPGQVVPTFGGIEVTTASTNLQALTDAMLYLVRYPFECAEQRSSRIIAIAALRDVLEAFKVPDMPSRAALEASVFQDLERLTQMQNPNGGFAWWERGYRSDPYLSVHVTNALARAKAKGFTIPAAMLANAKSYVDNIEQHIEPEYPEEVKHAISAYALYTRKLLGDVDIEKAKKLLATAGGTEKASMEINGWLLGTFAGNAAADAERKAIVRHVLDKVSETAGAANFTTSYADGGHLLLHSDRRVDAILLESLIQEQPTLDLIPKIVTGLLAHRKAGRWLNTQENSFALLALDKYFQTYEKVTPNFVARVWLGTDYAGDLAFKGRTTNYFQINIPMAAVATHDKQAITIQKDGPGRLYYRIGMKYAPASLKLEAADYGFAIERSYEGVDDPKDVTRDAAGVWHVKAGSRVRIKLAMANENRRYHVALVDPLPAGLEPLNPSLATTGPIPSSDAKEPKSRGGPYWYWYGPWYEHQNLRDERVEAFASMLWEGVHDYEYVARATTPGTFIVPPTKAEEMYMPETFVRSASDRMVVE